MNFFKCLLYHSFSYVNYIAKILIIFNTSIYRGVKNCFFYSLASLEFIMEEIKIIEMSELDYRLILHIKNLRENHNLTQIELSHKMGLSSGFVGKVELLTVPDKYSVRHLKLLADVFKFKNFSEMLPPKVPVNDMIRLTLRITYNTKRDGTLSKKKITEVIKIEALGKK